MFGSIDEIYDFCCKHLSKYRPELTDYEIDLSPWAFSLNFYYFHGLYLQLFTQGRLNSLYDHPDCREDIRTICEAFGATEWWICDEDASDIFENLTPDEFEMALLTQSVDYEYFLHDGAPWPKDCHFIADGSHRSNPKPNINLTDS